MKEAEKRHPGQFSVEYYIVIGRSHLVNMPKPKMGKKRKNKAAGEGATFSSSDLEPVFDFYENELIHKVISINNFVQFNHFCFHRLAVCRSVTLLVKRVTRCSVASGILMTKQ